MTIYDFYRRVAEILSPKHVDELFDYIIHSMDDDGGFLRSRYCYWEKTLEDHPFVEREVALVALRTPFDFENSTEYYRDGNSTLLKMQLFYCDVSDEESFKEEAEWSSCVGFPYPIRVDLKSGTYEILEKVETYY